MRLARLDGIRALAILAVIVHHHFMAPVGWVGVDLFFVLSGFLITNILRRSRDTSTYWARFYIKRAARILPALLLLFAAELVLSPHLSLVGLLGYGLFLGNVMTLTRYNIPIFGLVLWSLAVEEHFYLLWPWAVRSLSRGALVWMCGVILVIEPLLRALATPFFPTFLAIYTLTPFRLDGLAGGALLAIFTAKEGRPKVWLTRWSGAGAVTLVVVFGLIRLFDPDFRRYANATLFNSIGYSMVALCCFFVVALVLLHGEGRISRILSLRPLPYLGRISYGMYLFHPLVIVSLTRIFNISYGPSEGGTRLLLPITLAVTVILAALSFRYVEEPVIAWAQRLTERIMPGEQVLGDQKG